MSEPLQTIAVIETTKGSQEVEAYLPYDECQFIVTPGSYCGTHSWAVTHRKTGFVAGLKGVPMDVALDYASRLDKAVSLGDVKRKKNSMSAIGITQKHKDAVKKILSDMGLDRDGNSTS